MTEAEWLTSTDLTSMLGFLKGTVSDRKLRLFACACCRRIWPLLTDERSRAAVIAAEDFAEGRIGPAELQKAHAGASEATLTAGTLFSPGEHAAVAAFYCVTKAGLTAVASANRAASSLGDGKEAEQKIQCDIFRDIAGSLSRPMPFDRLLLAPVIVRLGQTIHEDRSFERMPELATALETDGCTNANILAHCRRPGQHVRGCWVIDLILRKA